MSGFKAVTLYTRGPTPVRDLYGKLKRLDSQQPTFFKQRVNFCQFSCFQMVLLKTYKSFFEMENLIYSVGKNRKYNKPQKAYVHTNTEI